MKQFKGTPGPWVYDPKRDTHDSIIHTVDAKEEFGYISSANGGVVGSSEWIWLKKEDAQLISAAPEMLEALMASKAIFEAQGINENHSIAGEQYKKVVQAINKAIL